MTDQRARVGDVHAIAASMPGVRRAEGPEGNPIYQVGGKSFVFFRTPRPDATDPVTGERYPDVIMLWVESESARSNSSRTHGWRGRRNDEPWRGSRTGRTPKVAGHLANVRDEQRGGPQFAQSS